MCTFFTPTWIFFTLNVDNNSGLLSLGVPGVPWHPQILADQLTLFQPGGDRLCPSNYYCPSRIFRPSDGSALEVGTWMHLAKNKVTKTCLYDATAFTLNLIKHSFCNALLINDTFYYLKKIMQCEKGHDLVTYLH